MYQSVSLGNIAVKENDFEKKLLLAKKHGFKYMEAGAPEIMEVGVETVKALLEKHEMGISSCGLPFHPVEVSEEEFEKAMEVFPAQAAVYISLPLNAQIHPLHTVSLKKLNQEVRQFYKHHFLRFPTLFSKS